MRKSPLKILALILAAGAASSAAELGSIVSSFITATGGSQPPTSGMTYVNGSLWTVQMERSGASLLRRNHPGGSILSSYYVATEDLVYSCLTYDGQYFWVGCCEWWTNENPKLLKISAATMSLVASVPLNWYREGQITGLAWEAPYLWFSHNSSDSEIYRLDTGGSVVASFPIPYDAALGIAYAPGLTGGARLFEGYSSGGGSDMVRVYKAAGHVRDYRFEIAKKVNTGSVQCWDGDYLWVLDPSGEVKYAYRIVAWPPDVGVTPASLGRVKALFR